MADNKIELVVQVDVEKANAAIVSVNRNLSNIDQAARTAASGASRGMDGITVSVVKAAAAFTILQAGFEKVLGWIREFTVESAKLAARNETLGVVNTQLAKVNEYSEGAITRLVDRMKLLGITTQVARDTVNKMIIAQLDLSKATQLARLAQDAAVVSGQNSSEALEGLMKGITTQQIEVLRTYGINITLERDYNTAKQRLGRDITDLERKNIALNRVLGEAPKLAGAYEAAFSTVGKQITSLDRFVEEAQATIGAKFLPELSAAVKALTELAQWAKNNADGIAFFAKSIGGVALGAAIGQFITWIKAATGVVNTLTVAMAANPYTVIAVGAAVAGAAIYQMSVDADENWKRLKKQNDEAARMKQIWDEFDKGTSLEGLKKKGFAIDEVRKAMSGGKASLDGSELNSMDNEEFRNRIKIVNEKELAEIRKMKAQQLAKEIVKKQHEIQRETLKAAESAEKMNFVGPAKAVEEVMSKARSLTVFADSEGIERQISLTNQTRLNLERELQAKVQHIRREAIDELLKKNREEFDEWMKLETARSERRMENDTAIAKKNLEHMERVYAFEESRSGFARDQQLRKLDMLDAQTLRQKLFVEQRKAAIEVEHLERVAAIKERLWDMETSRLLIDEEMKMKVLGYQADAIAQRLADLTAMRDELRAQAKEEAHAGVVSARESSVVRQAQLVRDEQRKIFDSLKHQAEGVFDALLTKSQSIWSAIGNSLKTALLTAIKDVVSSRVAAMLMQLFTGTRVSFANGGGLLGGVGVGSSPVFSGSGGRGLLGALGTVGSLGAAMMPSGGMPGATPPFVAQNGAAGGGLLGIFGSGGGSGTGAAGAAGKGSGGLLGALGLGGSAGGLKGLLSSLGNLGYGPKGGDFGGEVAGSYRGVGGATGGLMMLGGGILAMDGLRRGGWVGLGETTAGGALIGAKFGGPVGAAIGAAVGFAAGTIRMFIKGASEKAREKVKALYGVDVSDKGVLKQIVDLAKSTYGGNLDLALRSPQIRDLINLYAMTTGQKPQGLQATTPQPMSFVESGGSLFQSPSYSNGSQLPSMGGLPGLDRIGAGMPSGGTTVNYISIPAAQVGDFLEGKVIQVMNQPGNASAALQSSFASNNGRREITAMQLSPGTLVS